MTDMVEKVSNALRKASGDNLDLPLLSTAEAMELARAAMEAIRDLDETTFALALHEIDDLRGPSRESKQVFREFFKATIDAALSNTRESGE